MQDTKTQIFSYTETPRKNTEENEDSHYCYQRPELNFTLLLVCDGLGGAPGGKTASETIKKTFTGYFDEVFIKKLVSINDSDEIILALKMRLTSILNSSRHVLKQEFDKENGKRKQENKPLLPEKHKRGGFSSTFSCVVILRDLAFYTWVGDSRIYLIRDGRLKTLSFDHSDGVLHKNFNELDAVLSGKIMTKCVSPFADDEFVDISETEIFTEKLKQGDVIFCASDGIFDYLLPWTLEMVFIKNLAFNYTPEEYVKKIYYQIRPVFQDDTTIATAFIGKPKPFPKRFPFLDDAFFYLNNFSFNKLIEEDFNRYPDNMESVKPAENWKEYKNRNSWENILKKANKITDKQEILSKVLCVECMQSFLQNEIQGDKCPFYECKGKPVNMPFIEIYVYANIDYDNPYRVVIGTFSLNNEGNSFNLNISDHFNEEIDKKIINIFNKNLEIKNKGENWEIHSKADNELYVFYPEVFSQDGLILPRMNNIMIGKDIFEFKYPLGENGNKAVIHGKEMELIENKYYFFGQSLDEDSLEKVKNKQASYIEFDGDYVDSNSGLFLITEKGVVFRDAKFDNGLFLDSGKNKLIFKNYPENLMIKVDNICVALRGKT